MIAQCAKPDDAFETHRLHIRLLKETDQRLFCGLYTDAETMRHIAAPLSAERAARSFQSALRLVRRDPLCRLFFALVHKNENCSIGICSIQGIDSSRRHVEAGIIVSPEFRSRGFASEALSALIEHAFRTLSIDEVRVRIAVDHAIVERLVVGVGFLPGSEAPEEAGRPAQRVWSAFRRSWTPGRKS